MHAYLYVTFLHVVDHPMMKFVFVFTALGLCIEIVGHITCLIEQKFTKKKIFMFITGVLYVFSGESERYVGLGVLLQKINQSPNQSLSSLVLCRSLLP